MVAVALMCVLMVFVYMTTWFIIAIIKKDNGIADVAWGLGFVLIAWLTFTMSPQKAPRQWLITLFVTIWGLRLAIYIAIRNSKKKGEDFRYKNWRKDWGENWLIRSFLQVFMLQGLIMLIIAIPVFMTNFFAAGPIFPIDSIAIVLFTVGFLMEAIADYQLYRFKSLPENKGKIMTSGLWKYSRHPNYFGEVLVWWGIFLLSVFSLLPYISIISPILITFLLTRVSGVPMLEAKYKTNPEYAAYIDKTSSFIPMPPKK